MGTKIVHQHHVHFMSNTTQSLDEQLRKRTSRQKESGPVIFDLSDEDNVIALDALIKQNSSLRVCDEYEDQLREYFQVMHPDRVYVQEFETEFAVFFKRLKENGSLVAHGRWAWFPWKNTLVHILDEQGFYAVRTARNRLLITAEEQKQFYDGVVGIAGLSVGNSVALALVLQGAARHIKLADFDRLALSNTNRIRTSIDELGELKVDVTARQIYELNPYAQIERFAEGLTEQTIESFFEGLDVVVDEIDSLAMKYLIRTHAQKRKLPVIMGADCGDNAVIDIERYDQNPELEFFHGRVGDITYEELLSMNKFEIGKTIAKHIGHENLTDRIHQSLQQMGKTIVSWPQLGGAALINGSAIAYGVRKILNGDSLEDNRAIISLDVPFHSEYTKEDIEK